MAEDEQVLAEPSSDDLIELMNVFQQIDINDPLARLNETTMDDNNGGCIEF